MILVTWSLRVQNMEEIGHVFTKIQNETFMTFDPNLHTQDGV